MRVAIPRMTTSERFSSRPRRVVALASAGRRNQLAETTPATATSTPTTTAAILQPNREVTIGISNAEIAAPAVTPICLMAIPRVRNPLATQATTPALVAGVTGL